MGVTSTHGSPQVEEDKAKRDKLNNTIRGFTIGISIGTVLGVTVFNNAIVGVVIGVLCGPLFGIMLNAASSSRP